MDYEATLNQALDLLADSEDRKALRLLDQGIAHIKANLTDSNADKDRLYYWGRFLTAMEEYEQALLKFEKALKIDPDHQPSLWETASILFHDLDRPELAKVLLSEKLLPLDPANQDYVEALKEVGFLLRVRNSPPVDPRGGSEHGQAEGEVPGDEPDWETGNPRGTGGQP